MLQANGGNRDLCTTVAHKGVLDSHSYSDDHLTQRHECNRNTYGGIHNYTSIPVGRARNMGIQEYRSAPVAQIKGIREYSHTESLRIQNMEYAEIPPGANRRRTAPTSLCCDHDHTAVIRFCAPANRIASLRNNSPPIPSHAPYKEHVYVNGKKSLL